MICFSSFNGSCTKTHLSVILSLVALLALAGCPQGEVWYVTPDGSGSGASWGNALGSIQDAVNAASRGGGEVWVAGGIYTARTDDVVVSMAEDVHLYGGFAGTETARDERDWETHETTIDGEGARRCVYGADDATLDGFVVQNGYSSNDGGGGGMYNFSSSPTVINCTFTGNTATGGFGGGGGMFNSSSSSPTVINCTFTGNTADTYGGGGGMFNSSSSPSVTNCTFTENTASWDGGGMFNSSSSSTVINCTFTGNTAGAGGGMLNYSCSPWVENCTFAGNTGSGGGGGVFDHSSSPSLMNCAFIGNTSLGAAGGGGIYNYFSSPIVTNCTFAGGTADGGGGGGMSNHFSSYPMVMNCTFAGNTATWGGGGVFNYSSSSVVMNCILWDDSALSVGSEITNSDSASAAIVAYSCVEGGYDGEGNISSDPLFVDAANGDYSLQSGSPCIDTGTADGALGTDIEGTERPQGSGYDMGAYEYAAGR